MIHTFENNATLKFTKLESGFYSVQVEQEKEIYKIPLLLGETDYQVSMENLQAIKWMDTSFPVFCMIIAGFLSIIIKYKSPVTQALAAKSPLTYP